MPGVNPSRTIAVILGASIFPDAPALAAGRAFYISADDVKCYLREGLGVPEHSILWLFDDSRSPSEQLKGIGDFLERSTRETSEGTSPENLLIYYVGHGMFTPRDQAYCLAIRYTTARDGGSTSIRASDLADVIKDNALFLRRYLIFDCCFSASINKEFQSGALQAARTKLADEFPERGTALLCSSNASNASLAPEGLNHTMFSFALIEALKNGHRELGDRFSFSQLGSLVKETLRKKFPDNWVRPEVHSPDQREGDIADIAIFPNPAYRVRTKAARAQTETQELEREEAANASPLHEKARMEPVRRARVRPASPPAEAPKAAAPPWPLPLEEPGMRLTTSVPPPIQRGVRPEPAVTPGKAVSTAAGQPAASSDDSADFVRQRASLSWFRRLFLLYKPAKFLAWIPRGFFYCNLALAVESLFGGAIGLLLGSLTAALIFRTLSVWMETPSVGDKLT